MREDSHVETDRGDGAHLSTPAHLRGIVVYPLLALLYPVGLFLLIRAPRPKRAWKIASAAALLPVFVLVVLIALKPYWRFSGYMRGMADFSLDMDSLLNDPDGRLEAHRHAQAESEIPSRVSGVTELSWTDFRGPGRDGVCRNETISLDWQTDPPRELWRQPVGGGYASFVVADGRAYTIEQRRRQEVVTCYEVASGREVWAFAYDASFEETLGGDGPRATPTYHDGFIFALGAQGHLHCLKADTGEVVWKTDLLKGGSIPNLEWGLSGSPLIVDDLVIVTHSGKADPSIFAFDFRTGAKRWETAGSQGYSSPALETICGVRQVLNLGGTELRSLDLSTGKVLWRHPWDTYMWINASQPLPIGGDRVFLSAGYGHGAAVVQVTRDGETWKTEEVWALVRSMQNKFSSSVIYQGHAYGLDEAILCCVDLATGERKWRSGRYNFGSVLLVNDHLLVLSEDGRLALIKAQPTKRKEIGSVEILEGRTWNNFVVVGGLLLARNDRWMVCYDLRPSTRQPTTAKVARGQGVDQPAGLAASLLANR